MAAEEPEKSQKTTLSPSPSPPPLSLSGSDATDEGAIKVVCQECEVLPYDTNFFSQYFSPCASLNQDKAEEEVEFDYWPNISETEDDIDEVIKQTLNENVERAEKNERLTILTSQLKKVRDEIHQSSKPAITKIMEWSASSTPDKYLLLLSLLTAAQQSLIQNKDARAISLIISLTSSLTILIRRQGSNQPQLTEIEGQLRAQISELVLGPAPPAEEISRASSLPPQPPDRMCSSLMIPQCSVPDEAQYIKVTIPLDEAKTRLLTGLDVTDAYLDTITVHVGELSTGSSEEATIGRLLQCAIYTYRQVLEHDPDPDPVDPAIIVDNLTNNNDDEKFIKIRKLGSLLGRLMHLCGRLSLRGGSAIVGVTIRIIRSIHNGLLYGGLYPYVITASVVYYARYEIAAGVYEFGRQGLFYILRTTVAQEGLQWLQDWLKNQVVQAATEAATGTATQVAKDTARKVVTDAMAEQTRQKITNTIALRVLEYVANPDNLLAIAQGVTEGAALAIRQGGGKRKRTKKRKRRRRGGSKKTKRRGKKSKKGGKRRRGGSKKRNRRSQRKTKK